MKILNLLLAVVVVIGLSSCEDQLDFGFPGTGTGSGPTGGGSTGGGTTGGGTTGGGTTGGGTTSRYNLGLSTGQGDASILFLGAFTSISCGSNPIGEDDPDDLVDNLDESGNNNSDPISPDTEISHGSNGTCYVPQSSGARSAFNQDVINYRQFTQAKINSGSDVQFNRGLLDGFNRRLLQYSLNYGISMP